MGGLVDEAQVEAALVEELVLRAHETLHEVDHVGALGLHLLGGVLQARKAEHGVDEARQAADLGCDGLEVLVVGGEDPVLHGLDRRLHGHERGTQLMGDVARETVLELDVLLERGRHVVEGLAELTDLVGPPHARAGGEVAVAELRRRGGDAQYGLGERARHEVADDTGENHRDGRSSRDGAIGVGAEGRVALGEEGV